MYAFRRAPDRENTFLFETAYDLLYEIKFQHTPYIFVDEPEFSNDIYELSVILAEGNHAKTPPDLAIATTVLAICVAFIEHIGHPIFLFICDSRDGRQAVRARTFDRWFKEAKATRIAKFDGSFPDGEGVDLHISFILQIDHPYYREAVAAFADLIYVYNQPK